MKKFVMILRNDGSEMPPDKIGPFISDLFDWLKDLKSKEIYMGGDILMDDGGTSIKKVGERIQLGGPHSTGKDIVRGFYYFRAKDQIALLQHCQTCPVLNFGWNIELREVDIPG